MRTWAGVLPCALVMLSLLRPVHAAESSEGAYVVVREVVGEVQIRRSGAEAWQKAAVGDRMLRGDWIRTGKSSGATVSFCGGASERLSSDTQMQVVGDCRLQVERGKAWQDGGKGLKLTPEAAAKIRG